MQPQKKLGVEYEWTNEGIYNKQKATLLLLLQLLLLKIMASMKNGKIIEFSN